jgi:hypothetical protein
MPVLPSAALLVSKNPRGNERLLKSRALRAVILFSATVVKEDRYIVGPGGTVTAVLACEPAGVPTPSLLDVGPRLTFDAIRLTMRGCKPTIVQQAVAVFEERSDRSKDTVYFIKKIEPRCGHWASETYDHGTAVLGPGGTIARNAAKPRDSRRARRNSSA